MKNIAFWTPALLCALAATTATHAGVTTQEAARLKSDLTPLGAERAGNADGSIPPWTGGHTTAIPGFKNGGRRGDPFANEKPLYSVTADNMAQHVARLTEGTQALLKKYPKTFRVDVYKTHRTAAAPQWVYDNTFRNATSARIEGDVVTGAYGGIPFPIPKTGQEIMAANFRAVEIWSAVAVIYLCMIGALTFALRTVEKRMRIL